MKVMGLLFGSLVLLLASSASAEIHCSAQNGYCCECIPPGDCVHQVNGQNLTDCHCSCFGLGIACTADNKPCTSGKCPTAPASITHADLDMFPWLGTPKIAVDLSEHSVMPSAPLVYYLVQASELIQGVSSHTGVITADPRVKGYEWFQILDDRAAGYSELTLYYDPEKKWHMTRDIEHSKVRVPAIETVKFYADHWEQVNAKGTFTGKVEPAK